MKRSSRRNCNSLWSTTTSRQTWSLNEAQFPKELQPVITHGLKRLDDPRPQ